MKEELSIYFLWYKSSNIYAPKTEVLEKNMKLNIIFKFKATDIGSIEAQLLIKSEIKMMNKNLSYL